MPELPEVETVRRGLEPAMVGARFAEVTAAPWRPALPLPGAFRRPAAGRTVEALGRRAKYLLADLSDGEVLVMHLGMTGRFTCRRRRRRLGAWAHSTTSTGGLARTTMSCSGFSNGFTITYNDPRASAS